MLTKWRYINPLPLFFRKYVSKKSIYMAHRRGTSNALNASVRCEQRRLQRLSETVPANNWIPQAVWREFQIDGPARQKARQPYELSWSWWRGTTKYSRP